MITSSNELNRAQIVLRIENYSSSIECSYHSQDSVFAQAANGYTS